MTPDPEDNDPCPDSMNPDDLAAQETLREDAENDGEATMNSMFDNPLPYG
ncbi:hypothetical protein [Gluconobacter morbifer]|uniref:Uncharacterized protein n=1 Tax=Gluconobacter morbifer G707 TaxID=1088869 RepID=G6XK21_9PROT|nr:hypothetical protein [Gluconobacter morbifer]EHH67983.1 hypothetical protein GMO_17500 [Gluconobacter morbifer G707]